MNDKVSALPLRSWYDAGMDEARIVLTLIILVGWVAIWWLAVRIIRGQHYDLAEAALIDSLLVAVFAFGGPMIIADFIATQ